MAACGVEGDTPENAGKAAWGVMPSAQAQLLSWNAELFLIATIGA
jgi:hypothetical protein